MSNDEALAIMNKNGSQEDSIPRFTLEFVNVGTVSQAEKERNQKIIRSTAMRAFRRSQHSERLLKGQLQGKPIPIKPRIRRTTSEKNSKSDEREAPGPSDVVNCDLFPESSLSEVSWLVSGSSNDRTVINVDYFAPADRSQSSSSSSNSSDAPTVADGLLSPLGAGRVDPFRKMPLDTSSHINELIDHSVTHLWPTLRPRASSNAISSAWLEKVYERPVVMHALLFGATVHMDVLRSPRLSFDNPVRLYHKVQTMRLLKEELKSPEKAPLDDVMLAVLCLATNEVETVANNLKKKQRSPFNSPLTRINWLDVYGSITHIAAHTVAMRSLVSRRGGLEKVELEGLAEVLSFSDILGALQKLSKPHWPLLKRTIQSKLEISTPQCSKLGLGFQDLLSFAINEKLFQALQDMADLSLIIDNHCSGNQLISDIAVLVDHRNIVQHNLLSLPKGEELEPGDVNSVCVYDSIWLAAVIYSAAVIFPLPPVTGIYRKFAASLKTTMGESQLDPSWQTYPKTLLWILVLGGIAATGTPERAWYVDNISSVSSALNVSEWEEAAEELENYLWLESVCDTGGRLLWTEVTTYRTIREVYGYEIQDFWN